MNLILGFCKPRSSAQSLLMATVNICKCTGQCLGYKFELIPEKWCLHNFLITLQKTGDKMRKLADTQSREPGYLVSQTSPILAVLQRRSFRYGHTKSGRHCGTEWGWLARLADTVGMAYLGMEMKSESCVGGGGRENWLVKIAWIRACIKPDCQTT